MRAHWTLIKRSYTLINISKTAFQLIIPGKKEEGKNEFIQGNDECMPSLARHKILIWLYTTDKFLIPSNPFLMRIPTTHTYTRSHSGIYTTFQSPICPPKSKDTLDKGPGNI